MFSRIARVATVGAALLGCSAIVVSTRADDYGNWNYYKPVYLNTTSGGADVSTNVEEFPVLVRLTSSDFDFSEAQGNGEDIRFAKEGDGTHLSYEIEEWDSSGGSAVIWVLADSVHGDDSTEIQMYWGMATAGDSSDGEAVFDTANGFAGVYHFAPADTFADATANSNDGTNVGTSADATTTIIGTSRKILASESDMVQITCNSGMPVYKPTTGAQTFSAWVNKYDWSTDVAIYGETRNGNDTPCWLV